MKTLSIIHTSDVGQRIDRFCKKYLPNAALGGIYKMLRIGKIKVNGKKKDQTYRLEMGDEVNLWLSDEEIQELKNSKLKTQNNNIGIQNAGDQVPQFGIKAPLDILYEDEYLMVINKPSGLNVHAGDHKTDESNLIDQVQDYLNGQYDSLTFRPALVHRIDRDTSGCILIAKEKNVLDMLLADLQLHKIEKVYHAFVSGSPPKKTDTIRARLLRVQDAKNEAKVRVDDLGQSAVTHYRVLKNQKGKIKDVESSQIKDARILILPGSDPIFSLLECRIETGRTHQIRVHLAHIGCPILGDKAYGDKKINSYVARQYNVTRQMLHARSLGFIHPITRKRLEVEASYMEDFQRIIDAIDTERS